MLVKEIGMSLSVFQIVQHTGRAPSTVSYHLKRLVNAKIISVDQDNFQIQVIK